ncbi:MAG: hypothetical protein KAI17_04945 [Thiotrichaceae bacterium]|nr:hypothetical protein [Thiotrichaceae bacterium]
MNPEKLVFGFFIVMALTLNFGFVLGEIDNPTHHHVYELAAAMFVSLVATILKFGDRSHVGSLLLASSLVADLQLFAAAIVWTIAEHIDKIGTTPEVMSSIVSLASGAMLANIISVLLLVVETITLRR